MFKYFKFEFCLNTSSSVKISTTEMFKTLAIAFVAVFGLVAAGPQRDVDDIDYYNCKGKPDGNYRSPINYMQFITCHNGRASERDCGECHVDPQNCPQGRLCFIEEIDRCEWVNDPRCDRNIGTPSTPPTTTTTEGVTPPPDGETTTAGSGPGPNPGNGFCKGTPATCNDNDDCHGNGCCIDKWICVRVPSPWGPAHDTHDVRTSKCDIDPATGDQLYFNPNSTHPFGGVCDLFGNLDDSIKRLYREDPNCIDPQCECEPATPCSSQYTCHYPKTGITLDLNCGPGEGFDKNRGCVSDC